MQRSWPAAARQPHMHQPNNILMFITRFSCLEARCVCRQAADKAAKVLSLAGLARSEQKPNQPWAWCSVVKTSPASRGHLSQICLASMFSTANACCSSNLASSLVGKPAQSTCAHVKKCSSEDARNEGEIHLIEHSDLAQVDGLPAGHVGPQGQVHVLHCCAAVPAPSRLNGLPPPHACTEYHEPQMGTTSASLTGLLVVTRLHRIHVEQMS